MASKIPNFPKGNSVRISSSECGPVWEWYSSEKVSAVVRLVPISKALKITNQLCKYNHL